MGFFLVSRLPLPGSSAYSSVLPLLTQHKRETCSSLMVHAYFFFPFKLSHVKCIYFRVEKFCTKLDCSDLKFIMRFSFANRRRVCSLGSVPYCALAQIHISFLPVTFPSHTLKCLLLRLNMFLSFLRLNIYSFAIVHVLLFRP